jgi:hypothetical protein
MSTQERQLVSAIVHTPINAVTYADECMSSIRAAVPKDVAPVLQVRCCPMLPLECAESCCLVECLPCQSYSVVSLCLCVASSATVWRMVRRCQTGVCASSCCISCQDCLSSRFVTK